MEIDHEIFSTVILSHPLIQEDHLSVSGERMCRILVPLIQEGKLSVSGERMCTILVNCLED